MFKENFKIEWKENFNETLKVYQHLLYYLGRVLAVFIFGPFLLYKGTKYNDIYFMIVVRLFPRNDWTVIKDIRFVFPPDRF